MDARGYCTVISEEELSSGVQVGCIHSFVATGSDMSSRVKRLHTKIHKPIRKKKSLSFLML